jgi:PAS domain S-box-containing protein
MEPSAVPNQSTAWTNSVLESLLSVSVLEAIPDAVVAVNQQGVILQINSQTEKLFDYTRDELIGQKIEMLVPERQRGAHHDHRKQFHARPKIPAWARDWIFTGDGVTVRNYR